MKAKHWFGFILLATMLVACSDSQVAMTSTATNVPATATQIITPPPPTATIAPIATAIPLVWKQISDGQEFERDTVTAFATDKKDPNIIYAGMKNTGVYKTIDGGLSWQSASYGLVSMQVESLLIDSQNPLILYAGTMGGIFKTEDGGGNWSRIGDGTYLLMDTQDNSHLYARDENGVYETTGQGNTWKTVYVLKKECPDKIYSWAIHPKDGNMLFIGGGENCKGVYQSSDGGHDWTLIGLKEKLNNNINALAVGVDEQENYSIYTSLSTSPIIVENGLFVTHDGGANWSKKGEWGCDFILTAVNPGNPSDIYCGMSVLRGGDSPWRAILNAQSKAYTAVHIDHPNGTERIIAGATDVSKQSNPYVGIFISEDGGSSWAELSSGISSTWAEIKIDPMDNTRIFLGTYYLNLYGYTNTGCTLYRSLDGGKNWSQLKSRASWCGSAFDAANVLYMNQNGKLQKSWNGGDEWWWKRIDSYNPNTGIDIDNTLAYALPSFSKGGSQSVSANPYLQGFVYDVGNVIYYSTDAGISWQLSAGSEGSWDARLFYTDQGKMMYAIGRYHQKYSTDNGKTWQACGEDEDVTTSRSDSRLALDLQGTHLYLATSGNGVMVSTDNCQSWQASNEGLGNLFVNTLAIDPKDTNKIYAGTDNGAYISFDSGASWNQINDGLTEPLVVYSIVVDKDGNVYASTPYGIYQLDSK